MNDRVREQFDDALGTTNDTTFRARRGMERQYGSVDQMDRDSVKSPEGFGFDRTQQVYDTGGYDPSTEVQSSRMPTLNEGFLTAMRLFRDQNGQTPSYGFQPKPEPEYIGFIKQLVAGLNDPRTQAMLAPGMGLAKAPQAAWNATRAIPNMASERGNWNPFGWIFRNNSMDPRPEFNMNVPLSHMREQITNVPNAKAFVGHVEETNKIANVMRNGDETIRPMTGDQQTFYLSKMRETNPHIARMVEDSILGQRDLVMENNRAFSVEDKVPPEMLRRMFGYKGE